MFFLPHTWNNGMMEYWNVGFQRRFFFINILKFIVNMNFTNTPLYYFPLTQYSIIPTRLPDCGQVVERSELSSNPNV
jgi:hypothetical protein